jgi:hypothetical protein
MIKFISAVRNAIIQQNWYAALVTALTLPDICGSLETPGVGGSQKRYIRWFDQYLLQRYTALLGEEKSHEFLSGADCYALRCSYLHEGSDEITGQRARRALERFRFVAPRRGLMVHRNQAGSQLQLQVDIFCEEICLGVEQWERDVASVSDVQQRLTELLTIYDLDETVFV